MIKTNIDNRLYNYILKIGVKENNLLQELRQYTIKNYSNARMLISSDQAQFMSILAKIVRAKKYLEIGVFTGYSALTMAYAMGKNSMVYALDNNIDHIDVAKNFWQKARLQCTFNVMLDDALTSLKSLNIDHTNTFDIAFIDANKNNYMKYYNYCYSLIKSSGIILVDNILMNGKVLENNPKNNIKAIIEFNQFISNDSRVDVSVIPIADGLTIIYKKDA